MAAGGALALEEQLLRIPECSTSGLVASLMAAGQRGTASWGFDADMGRGEPRMRPLRKCASTPTLHSMSAACGEGEGMEVYVILRSFKEFGGGLFNRLPRRVKSGVRDSGICHYLAVFKQKDGSLVQFDFGPRGGDIHVAQGPFAFLSKSTDGKLRRLVPGEVREKRLNHLPDAHMFVGRTPLTLQDIRAWNSLQEQGSMDYQLHKNDCRHYINCLVRYTTGREQAASAALTHQWQRARQQGTYGLAGSVVRAAQFFTDLANWGKVQFVSNVSMYGMMALSGQKALARLKPAALLPAAKARLQPMSKALARPMQRALAGPVRQALVRKPIVVGTTAAVATIAASSNQAPLIKETLTVGAQVAVTIRTAAHAALGAASTAVARASAATARTTNNAAVMAGNLAGAATRGAAGLMAGRQPGLIQAGASSSASGSALWAKGSGSPLRASLPTFKSVDRSQRLALAITTAARR